MNRSGKDTSTTRGPASVYDLPSLLLLSFPMRLSALLTPHDPNAGQCRDTDQATRDRDIDPPRQSFNRALATGPEVDANLSLRFKIFRIELNLRSLLLSARLHDKGVAEIVVMEMQRDLVVSPLVRLDRLSE